MDSIPAIISRSWDIYTTTGAQFVQKITLALSGYEMSEFEALVVLLGASAGFLIWLALMFKRPKPTKYLMESGQRYYRY